MESTPNLLPELFLGIQNGSDGSFLTMLLVVSVSFHSSRIIIANSLLNNSALSSLISGAFVFLSSGALRLVDRLAHILTFILELAIFFPWIVRISTSPTIAGRSGCYNRLIPFVLIAFSLPIRGGSLD